MSGIESIITNHFEEFFWDVLSQAGDKIKNRNGFNNELIVFMAVVMKRNGIAIIRIDSRGSDNWSSQIAPDIFNN